MIKDEAKFDRIMDEVEEDLWKPRMYPSDYIMCVMLGLIIAGTIINIVTWVSKWMGG